MSATLEYTLPTGWCWASIDDLTSYVQRGKSPKYAERSALPVVNQKCVRWHGVQPEHLKFIDPAQWDAWAPERSLRDGDILWNSTGTGTIGRAAIYRPIEGYTRVVADSHVTIVRVRIGLPEYLHAWIRSPIIQGRIDAMQSGSTNQVELGRGEVLRTRVPVAPINEQRRIIAKLEALQSRSRRARQALGAVPPLLEKLRQSILAAAFRGDLTKAWRAKNPDVEPASKLLERIRAERRKKWEESELAKMKAKGKAPTDDKWKAKYKEPESVDMTGLPGVPDGWCWASVEELSARVTDGTHQSPAFTAAGIPFLVIANVINGRIDWPSVSKWVSRETYEANTARCRPERGDVLYTAVGSYGVALCIDVDDEFMFQRHIAHIKPLSAVVQPAFLALILNAPQTKSRADGVARGVAQKTVTLGELARFPVPVPPLAEQEEASNAVAELLGRVEAMEARLDTFVTDLETLNRSTLAKAFRGELVAQDPNDEPAGEMLDLAPAERGAVGRVSETKSRLARRRNAG